eukprot:TRINITY_DN7597_c0_g1_i1.p2 TRINITY_DN7597_c0_g1~~TRINITY_DN7597_c0_g1_i1.p2  ORF type:complete len:110 (+),score=4.95 TRINITY_DN7597_c0_g1_i1:31-330(+)
MAWAPPDEIFVKAPKIVFICYKSDDPQFYKEPEDLFDVQKRKEGLSSDHGKKDKKTGEQSYFRCELCECDLMSVITLRTHSKGSQHVLKALDIELGTPL